MNWASEWAGEQGRNTTFQGMGREGREVHTYFKDIYIERDIKYNTFESEEMKGKLNFKGREGRVGREREYIYNNDIYVEA